MWEYMFTWLINSISFKDKIKLTHNNGKQGDNYVLNYNILVWT